MAWIFGMAVECGSDKAAAEAVARHFNGFAVTIEGTVHVCSAGAAFEGAAWWAMSFDELDAEIIREYCFDGLVLTDRVWQHLGAPGIFVPFVNGYLWRPFVLH